MPRVNTYVKARGWVCALFSGSHHFVRYFGFFRGMSVLPACVYHTYVCCPWRPEGGVRATVTGLEMTVYLLVVTPRPSESGQCPYLLSLLSSPLLVFRGGGLSGTGAL